MELNQFIDLADKFKATSDVDPRTDPRPASVDIGLSVLRHMTDDKARESTPVNKLGAAPPVSN